MAVPRQEAGTGAHRGHQEQLGGPAQQPRGVTPSLVTQVPTGKPPYVVTDAAIPSKSNTGIGQPKAQQTQSRNPTGCWEEEGVWEPGGC